MISTSPFLNPLTRLPAPPSGQERYPVHNPTYSARHAHILRLHDLVQHLVSLPASHTNSVRTLRAWRALGKCREVNLVPLWRLGAAILERTREEGDEEEDEDEEEGRMGRKAEWVKACQGGTVEMLDKFLEYVLALSAAGRQRRALEELNSFLPSYPYHDHIPLNVLAGQLALFLAQSSVQESSSEDSGSDSDEDDEEGDSDSTSPERISTAPGEGGETGTARKKNLESVKDEDLSYLLSRLATESSTLFSQALEHFRVAKGLEERQPDESMGEGTRWYTLLSSTSTVRSNKRRRASDASSEG